MEAYHIKGRTRLYGERRINGAKNAALPILAATILTGKKCELHNVPDIKDIRSMIGILEELGCEASFEENVLYIDTGGLRRDFVSMDRMKEMRSSVFLMGALLGRSGSAVMGQPGGCNIGKRPIDLHLYALKQLGAEITELEDVIVCKCRKLKGAEINFSFPSVGATENAMMAAVKAEGVTVINNCAMEPEICDLQNFLNGCGARIKGAGSKRICIEGVRDLRGCCHSVIPDRIETGTYLAAAAATGGEILLHNAPPAYLKTILQKLIETGCTVGVKKDKIYVKAKSRLKAIESIETGPYPQFPTDLQSPFLSMLTTAKGKSCIAENIFEKRFALAEELKKLGADINITGRCAYINGVRELNGGVVNACDLRGGAALVIAGVMAEGETVVNGIEHIERGYEDLAGAFNSLGADIRKIDVR